LKDELLRNEQSMFKMEEMREKYLVLVSSIADIWQTWSKVRSERGCSLMASLQSDLSSMSKEELPDLSQPLQVLAAISNQFVLHSPTAAAKRIIELNGIASG
jgi:hypothetical protein